MALRGLEVHFSAIKNDLKSREDCLILALHVTLVNNDITCVGTGDEWPEGGDGNPSEIMPSDWNSNQEVYTLRYVSKSAVKYLVKAVAIPSSLLVNVLNINEEKVAYISISVDNYIAEEIGNFHDTYKNMNELCMAVENEVFKKMGGDKTDIKKASAEAKAAKTDDDEPVIIDELQPSSGARAPPSYRFPNIGRGDLDPFGGGLGGGMLLDPSRMGRGRRPNMPGFDDDEPFGLPRGAVPPGARFDPFDPSVFMRQNPGTGEFPPHHFS